MLATVTLIVTAYSVSLDREVRTVAQVRSWNECVRIVESMRPRRHYRNKMRWTCNGKRI